LNRVPSVWGMKKALKNVFEELIWNAIKYGSKKVEITIKLEDHHQVIIIKDNGIGLDAESLSKIFSYRYIVPGVKVGKE